MLLKASKRGGHMQLAHHLMNTADNEHVEVHEIKGVMAATLIGALQEMYGVSKGTQCHQFMFSVSLNPPQQQKAPLAYFEQAIEKIEHRCGLVGQPRVVVFHEKEGRRHCHVVWSRIDVDAMKAINQPFFKQRLNDLSRNLFLEHGWPLPNGYVDKNRRDPLNFTLEEWQQAKRMKENPKMLKTIVKDAWNQAADKAEFSQKLRENGFWLARGDRRGYVVVDYKSGEVLSLSRWSGIKTKELEAKLGKPEHLPSVDESKVEIASMMTRQMLQHAGAVKQRFRHEIDPLKQTAKVMAAQHKNARKALQRNQQTRQETEHRERLEKLPTGLRSLWAKATGRYRAIVRENGDHIAACAQRDTAEHDDLRQSQGAERWKLQERITKVRDRYTEQLEALRHDFIVYQAIGNEVEREAYLRQRLAQPTQCQSPTPGFDEPVL